MAESDRQRRDNFRGKRFNFSSSNKRGYRDDGERSSRDDDSVGEDMQALLAKFTAEAEEECEAVESKVRYEPDHHSNSQGQPRRSGMKSRYNSAQRDSRDDFHHNSRNYSWSGYDDTDPNNNGRGSHDSTNTYTSNTRRSGHDGTNTYTSNTRRDGHDGTNTYTSNTRRDGHDGTNTYTSNTRRDGHDGTRPNTHTSNTKRDSRFNTQPNTHSNSGHNTRGRLQHGAKEDLLLEEVGVTVTEDELGLVCEAVESEGRYEPGHHSNSREQSRRGGMRDQYNNAHYGSHNSGRGGWDDTRASTHTSNTRRDSHDGTSRPNIYPNTTRRDSHDGTSRPNIYPNTTRKDSHDSTSRPNIYPNTTGRDSHDGTSRPNIYPNTTRRDSHDSTRPSTHTSNTNRGGHDGTQAKTYTNNNDRRGGHDDTQPNTHTSNTRRDGRVNTRPNTHNNPRHSATEYDDLDKEDKKKSQYEPHHHPRIREKLPELRSNPPREGWTDPQHRTDNSQRKLSQSPRDPKQSGWGRGEGHPNQAEWDRVVTIVESDEEHERGPVEGESGGGGSMAEDWINASRRREQTGRPPRPKEPEQPVMTFKAFIDQCDNSISEKQALTMYLDYKRTFLAQNQLDLPHHEEGEWGQESVGGNVGGLKAESRQEYGGQDQRTTKERYSATRPDMSPPPVKRMRKDWDQPRELEKGGGDGVRDNHGFSLTPSQKYVHQPQHQVETSRPVTGEAPPASKMTFKQVMEQYDNSVTPDQALMLYSEYSKKFEEDHSAKKFEEDHHAKKFKEDHHAKKFKEDHHAKKFKEDHHANMTRQQPPKDWRVDELEQSVSRVDDRERPGYDDRGRPFPEVDEMRRTVSRIDEPDRYHPRVDEVKRSVSRLDDLGSMQHPAISNVDEPVGYRSIPQVGNRTLDYAHGQLTGADRSEKHGLIAPRPKESGQPEMMSFKKFMIQSDDSIPEIEALRMYLDYKKTFLDQHQIDLPNHEEEWHDQSDRLERTGDRERTSHRPYPENMEGHRPFSEDMEGHRPFSEDMKGHRSFPEDMEGHRPFPENMEGHRPFPENMEGHRPFPENMEGHRPFPEDMKGYRPFPEDMKGHRPFPEDFPGPAGPSQRPFPEDMEGHRPFPENMKGHRPFPEENFPGPAGSSRHDQSDRLERRRGREGASHRPYPEDIEGHRHFPEDMEDHRPFPGDMEDHRPFPEEDFPGPVGPSRHEEMGPSPPPVIGSADQKTLETLKARAVKRSVMPKQHQPRGQQSKFFSRGRTSRTDQHPHPDPYHDPHLELPTLTNVDKAWYIINGYKKQFSNTKDRNRFRNAVAAGEDVFIEVLLSKERNNKNLAAFILEVSDPNTWYHNPHKGLIEALPLNHSHKGFKSQHEPRGKQRR